MLDWFGSALAGKGARPVETIARFIESMGPTDGPSEVLIHRTRIEPARRGGRQRGGVAFRRTGRRAQRFGVSSGHGRVPRGARGRAGARAQRRAVARGQRRRLRSRHPRRRISRPLALQDLPHDRHRRHVRGGGGGRQPARAQCRADAARLRFGRHAVGGAVGVSARRGGFEAAAHRARGGRWPERRVPRARRLHRRAPHPRRVARPRGRHVERRRCVAAHRRPRHTLDAGRDVVQVPRVVPPHASGRRCVAAACCARIAWARRT